MAEGGGVDDDRRAPVAGALDRLDQLGLGVGLQMVELEAGCSGGVAGRRHVVFEGLGAVDLRLAVAEQVEVGPREEQHDGLGGHRTACSAARTTSSDTPFTTSTPAGPSSAKVMPS